MRPRPVLHETEAETKTSYCETETETKKLVLRPRWSRDLNIPGWLWPKVEDRKWETTF